MCAGWAYVRGIGGKLYIYARYATRARHRPRRRSAPRPKKSRLAFYYQKLSPTDPMGTSAQGTSSRFFLRTRPERRAFFTLLLTHAPIQSMSTRIHIQWVVDVHELWVVDFNGAG